MFRTFRMFHLCSNQRDTALNALAKDVGGANSVFNSETGDHMTKRRVVQEGGKKNYRPEDLSTVDGISRELRRVYTDYRRGAIDGVMAGKSTYMLRELNNIMAVRELQERLVCLEDGRQYIPPGQRISGKQATTIEGEAVAVPSSEGMPQEELNRWHNGGRRGA